MILGPDGKRLSKRHGAVSVLQFQEDGILPHALLNYLLRLGWSYGDQEIFSRAEMMAKFNLDNISRSASSFDHEKLAWLNQHYQKSDDPQQVVKALEWHFNRQGLDSTNGPQLVDLVQAQAQRCKNLADMCSSSKYFYQDRISYDPELVKKHLHADSLRLLKILATKLAGVGNWQKDVLQSCVNDLVVAEGISFGKLAQPLRVAVTGGSSSPSIDVTLALLGRDRVLSRLSGIEKVVSDIC